MKNNLTEREKIAIVYHVFAGCKDRKLLFTIAEGEDRANRLKDSSLKVVINNWFNSHKIQNGIQIYQDIKEREKQNIIDEYLQSIQETESPKERKIEHPNEAVNFLDLDEFLQYANEQANNITDEKERRAWVEMIGKYMNFKDAEEEEQEQIKAYLPIICENCELYKRCKGCKLSECIA